LRLSVSLEEGSCYILAAVYRRFRQGFKQHTKVLPGHIPSWTSSPAATLAPSLCCSLPLSCFTCTTLCLAETVQSLPIPTPFIISLTDCADLRFSLYQRMLIYFDQSACHSVACRPMMLLGDQSF
jgi:hypothetical protein